MTESLTRDAVYDLVANAANLTYSRLPREAAERARWGILDTLGAAYAGTRHPATEIVERVLRSAGSSPQATVIGAGIRLAIGDAALLNTANGRAFDQDDIHYTIGHHPSVSNVPAALAIAELIGASGRDVLTAVALGQDFGLRLRRACPLRLGGHTWAAQSYAAMEAALTAGKVLGLEEDRLRDAVGIAFLFFGGTPQSQHDGVTAHLFHHGAGTRSGIMAALLAAEGMRGVQNVLEGEFGLYPAYHKGQFNRVVLLDRLGEYFLGTEAGFKAYPTCSLIHGAIGAALELHNDLRPAPDAIAAVRVIVNRSSYLSCARQPWSPPKTATEAQFSIPYAVALALSRGRLLLQDFTPEHLNQHDVLEVAARVVPIHDSDLDRFPTQTAPTTVELKLRDGREETRVVEHARGFPENPMTADELRQKFRDCVAFGRKPLETERAEHALALIERLENQASLGELIDTLA